MDRDSYADLFNALQRIETAAVFLPSFKITHEGGLEAVVQNIVDAIAAMAQPEQEPAAWNSVGATSLEFETECADGTRFLNVAEMPSHAVRWRIRKQ